MRARNIIKFLEQEDPKDMASDLSQLIANVIDSLKVFDYFDFGNVQLAKSANSFNFDLGGITYQVTLSKNNEIIIMNTISLSSDGGSNDIVSALDGKRVVYRDDAATSTEISQIIQDGVKKATSK